MAAADGQLPGRVLYDVGSPDALAHWLAQHPYVVMLAGSSHLDTYLDTATGALLRQGQVLRVRRRDGASDALLRDLHTDTTLVEAVSDGGLPEGGAIDARVRALAGREQIGTVRTVMTRRRRFVLMARRDWDTEITIDSAVVTAHGMLPARHVTCEVVALRRGRSTPCSSTRWSARVSCARARPSRGSAAPAAPEPRSRPGPTSGTRRSPASATRRRRPRTTAMSGNVASGFDVGRRRGAAPRRGRAAVDPDRRHAERLRRHVVVEQALGDVQDLLPRHADRSCA